MVPYVDGLIFKLINFPSHLNWNQGILNMTVGKLLDAKYYKSENIIEWPINVMNEVQLIYHPFSLKGCLWKYL